MQLEVEIKWDGVDFSHLAKDKKRWRDIVEKANSCLKKDPYIRC
jgi:hypothetical protein